MRAALSGLVRGLLTAGVADVRTTVDRSVGVEDFAIVARLREAEAVAAANDGRGVDDGDDEISQILAAAKKTKHAVIGVVGVNPFETVPLKIDFMEGWFGGVKMIQIADELLNPAMRIPSEQIPVEAAGFAPFMPLRKFLPHEEQLLSRMRVVIGVEQAEIGKLLPHVAGHFVEQRIFAVNDFVVGEGKYEILGKGVEQ